jgi:hypothetical protein
MREFAALHLDHLQRTPFVRRVLGEMEVMHALHVALQPRQGPAAVMAVDRVLARSRFVDLLPQMLAATEGSAPKQAE